VGAERRLGIALASLAVVGCAVRAVPPARAAVPGALPKTVAVDSIFAPFARPGSPGCAVGVYQAGELLFARGYGVASLEHGGAITPRTPFNVASLSKQFTAFAVHLLARRGRLSLDDDVRRHLPELPDVGPPVTVRHLLHHTSGLRAYEVLLMLTGWNRDHPLSRDDALALIGRQRTTGFPPGERQQYGNTNYILLAALVERVDGRPFAEFMAQELFRPLGMTSTQVRTDPTAVIPGRAEHYTQLRPTGFRRNYVWAFAHATGASNVVTTLEDLARWDGNFYTERVGGPGMTQAMYERARLTSGDTVGYASGLEVGEYRGLRTVGHSGSGGGDYYLLRFPDARATTAGAVQRLPGPERAGARLPRRRRLAGGPLPARSRGASRHGGRASRVRARALRRRVPQRGRSVRAPPVRRPCRCPRVRVRGRALSGGPRGSSHLP
jgi:CubicO group peptidase (beta-lactamase class C family)